MPQHQIKAKISPGPLLRLPLPASTRGRVTGYDTDSDEEDNEHIDAISDEQNEVVLDARRLLSQQEQKNQPKALENHNTTKI
jgi:hypothetical protein